MTVHWRNLLGFALVVVPSAASVAQTPQRGDGVEITVTAIGTTTSRADYVDVLVPIAASADTPAQARAALADKIGSFRNAVIKAGVAAVAVKALQHRELGFIGNEAYDDGDQPRPLPTIAKARATANALYRVEFSTPAQYDAVRQALEEMGLAMNPAVDAALRDEQPAMRLAIADAVAKARAQADAYAAAAGMRIVSLKRMENNCANTELSIGWTSRLGKLQMQMFGTDIWTVETTTSACLTFLAQR